MANKQYAKNIIANWAAFLTYVVVGLVLSPYVVKSLGSVQYGLWTLIMSLTGYYGFLDLGIQGGVGHYVSRYLASKQFDRLNNIVNTALTLMGSIGALIIGISFAVSFYFTRFFNVDAADETSVRLALVIIGLSVAAKFPFGVFQAMLVSSARYDIVSGISVVCRVSGAGAMIYSLTNGHGIVTLSLITAAMQTVEGLALLIMALRIVPQVRLRFFHFDRETFKESWNFGAFNFLINLFSQISTSLGPIVIGRMLDPVAVAHYSIGSNLLP